MTIYFLLAFAVLLTPFLLGNKRLDQKQARMVTCIVCAVMMFLVMGFRSRELGMYDVERVYYPMFREVQKLTFAGIFKRFTLIRGNFLQLFTKVFTLVSTDYNWWIFVTSVPTLASLAYVTYKRGVSKFACAFSLFLYMGLRLYGTNFYLIRHSFAMALLLLAFDAMVDKKLVKFLVFVLLATLFHSTALIFIVAYPLSKIKISMKQFVMFFAGFFFVTYLSRSLLNSIFYTLGSDVYYRNYASKSGFRSNIFILVALALFLLAMALSKYDFVMTRGHKNGILSVSEARLDETLNPALCASTVNMLEIAVFFMGMSLIISEFQRIGFFFLAVSTVGLSNLIDAQKDKTIRMGLYLVIFAGLVMFMSNALVPEMLAPYKSWLRF